MATFSNENSPKLAKKYECKYCLYVCNKESDLIKHFSTRKHQKSTFSNDVANLAYQQPRSARN